VTGRPFEFLLLRWHRTVGVASVLFLLHLLITGLPLQYTAELKLGGRHVTSPWVLDWYGIHVDGPVLQSGPLIHAAGEVWLNDQPVAALEGFCGVIEYEHGLLVCGQRQVLLLDSASGEVIDRFDFPQGIEGIGRRDDAFLLATPTGLLSGGAELVNWTPVIESGAEDPDPTRWAEAAVAPETVAKASLVAARARMLSVERLLQDLHSGRFFGVAGMVAIDVASALLLVLALSGLLIWLRQQRRAAILRATHKIR